MIVWASLGLMAFGGILLVCLASMLTLDYRVQTEMEAMKDEEYQNLIKSPWPIRQNLRQVWRVIRHYQA